MCNRVWAIWAAIGLSAGAAGAQPAPTTEHLISLVRESPAPEEGAYRPLSLSLVDEPGDVYPQIMPSRQEEGVNGGGVHFDLDFDWLSRYVYRGIDQGTIRNRPENAEQFNGIAEFDLGKLPHPFIGLFANIFSTDPVSRFEEVRPYFGLDWNLKPIKFTGGFISYIYPNRKLLDTQEVYGQITFDDSLLFHTERPMFSPYIYGAYDLDRYKGFYLEAGVTHDFPFDDWGVTISPYAKVAYVISQPHFALDPGLRDYGLQHYELGVVGTLSLNHVFNLGGRYGDWSVEGYLRYTDGLDDRLRADTLIWGGVGLNFRY
ncbi:MAG TPA: hypothetical protein VFC78_09255 [Tepidisphaeraceae bacterium]|nr:hypothetical protein [Tepidisphaeraceae bacterium]